MIFVSAAFPYKKIKVFVLVPPEQILSGIQQIAVLDFEGDGDYGKNFSDYFISTLLEKDRGIYDLKSGFLGMGEKKEGKTLQEGAFTNVYNIVERSRMTQVLNEQQLGLTGLVDQNQAVQIGKMLGVQAIVMGNVSYTHNDNNFKEERSYTKDKKRYTYYVNCKKRTVNAVVRARIIGTENGQILGSTESSRKNEIKKCDKEVGSIPPVPEMVDICLKDAAGEIANYIAPHYELMEYELEKIDNKEFKDLGEDAAEKAENLQIDDAYLVYKSIFDQDAYNPKLLYNLGIINEVVGNFDQSKEYYDMAVQLKDEKDYKKATIRIDKNVAFMDALKSIGIEIAPHNFQVSEAEKQAVLADKIQIKGKSSERVDVLAKPQFGSAVVGKVPGGVTFTVVKQDGEWYLIKLLGGKEGYVHKNDAESK